MARAAQLAIHVFLARVLGPVAYGLYAIGVSVFRTLLIIAPLGFDQAVLRFGARLPPEQPALRQGTVLQSLAAATAAGTGLGIGLVAAAPFLTAQLFGKPALLQILIWAGIGVPFATVLSVAASATRLAQKVEYMIASQELGQPLANLFLLVAILPLGLTAQGATACSTGSYALAACLAVWFACRVAGLRPGRLLRPSFQPMGRLLSFAIPASLAGVAGASLQVMDRLALGVFRPPEEAGIYLAIAQPAFAFAMIAGGINTMFSAMVPSLEARREQLGYLFSVSTRWSIYLGTPIFLVIWSCADPILHVLYGDTYRAGSTALVILTSGQFLNAAVGPTAALLLMTGRQKAWLGVIGSAMALDIMLCLVLIPSRGVVGASLASLASMALLPLAGTILVRFETGFFAYDRKLWKGAVAAMATTVILWSLGRLGLPSALHLGVACVVSPLVFSGTLILLKLELEDRELVSVLLSRRAAGAA